jgi:outer membrane protein
MKGTVLCVLLATSAWARGPDGEPDPILTLQRALDIAQAHQPNLRQARANTEAANARVREARAPLLPQLTGTVAYQRTTANFSVRPGFVPLGTAAAQTPSTFKTYDYFTSNVTASQLLYDFGQSWGQLRSAEASAQAQRGTQGATELQTRLDVRTNFFAARAQKSLLEVARNTLANAERHLQQIQGFVEVGTRPQIDLAQARTDRANARAQLISAENNYEISKARLNQVMGVEQGTAYDIAEETMAPLENEDAPVEELVKEAFHVRPELAAQDQLIVSNRELISSARGNFFPSVGVSTTFTENGTFASSAWNWNAQASLTWSIFDGLGTPARTAEASANLSAAQAQLDASRLSIRLEVEQQRFAVRAAKEGLVAAKEAETNARERLGLAEGRYQTGVGSIIELADSQLAYTAAAAQRVQAEYNLASARAALLKALGMR